jgi:hypothetical protein
VTGASPTGTVNFQDGGVSIGGCSAVALTGTGNSRTAACSTSALVAGTHSVVARYGGDAANAASSSASLAQVVNKAGTSTTIAAHTPDPSVLGAPIAVSVSLTVIAPGAGTPSGTITVSDGTVNCLITLPATSCNLTPTSAGAKTLTASYGGDANFSGSVSVGVAHGVNKVGATTMLSASANPSVFGQNVTFTATVTGASPTGAVNFQDGGVSIGGCSAVALAGTGNSRTAACSTSALAAGTHSVVASYGGDGANAASSSAPLPQVVNATGAATVWVEDAVPLGATVGGDGEGWNWVSGNPAPFSGALAHQSALASGVHQHYFYNATTTLAVGVGETLYAYVYLDPVNPPSEVVLQWNDGSWEHRAYWGANLIGYWGVDGAASRRYMGPLPVAGQWVRLEVPAAQVGLEGRTLNGMAFSLYGGRATWDTAGKAAATP